MSYGFVYLACNASMPGLYKIGSTANSPALRIRQLSSPTAVPSPFELMGYYEVYDHAREERLIHSNLSEYRTSNNREFFKLSPGSLVELEWTFKINGLSFWIDTDAFVDQHRKILELQEAEEAE